MPPFITCCMERNSRVRFACRLIQLVLPRGLPRGASFGLLSPTEPVVHRSMIQNPLGALLLVVSLAGCATMNVTSCGGDGRLAVQEQLYFGTDTPSGHVTPEAWAQFLSEIVTPHFPEGLSVWQASGQWRSASGDVIREPSYVLSLVHSDDAAPSMAVQEIISSYKTRFQQEAVLRVKSYTCISL
jgi:hypothetical protein